MCHATIAALLAAVLLSGCLHYAQTRDEFRQSIVSSDSRFKYVDTHVAKRRFEDVVKSLKQNVQECFDQNVTTTRTQGGMTTMRQTDEWRTTLEVIDGNRAEVTTRQTMKGAIVPGQPAGGFYVNAVDIERATRGTTKLSFYGNTSGGSKERWELIRQWSDGKHAPCPK